MALQSAPYWWLKCDQEGCKAISSDDGDYTAWANADRAIEDARDYDWVELDEKHYCPKHGRWLVCSECDGPAGDGAIDREGMCRACWDKG